MLLAAVFYSLFLFDIFGDDVGWLGAFWAPLTLTLVSVTLYVFYHCSIRKSTGIGDKAVLSSPEISSKIDGVRAVKEEYEEEKLDSSGQKSTFEVDMTLSPFASV